MRSMIPVCERASQALGRQADRETDRCSDKRGARKILELDDPHKQTDIIILPATAKEQGGRKNE